MLVRPRCPSASAVTAVIAIRVSCMFVACRVVTMMSAIPFPARVPCSRWDLRAAAWSSNAGLSWALASCHTSSAITAVETKNPALLDPGGVRGLRGAAMSEGVPRHADRPAATSYFSILEVLK